MTSDFRQQLLAQFEQKETAELLAIWQENDRVEWSSQTFEVVAKILKARLGELPPQNEPILEHSKEILGKQGIQVDPSSSLYPYLCEENAPVLYKPRDVFRLERWLNRLAWAVVGLKLLFNLFSYYPVILEPMWNRLDVPSFLLVLGWTILDIAMTFLMLKALAFILKMLMQMEFSSRGIGTRRAE